VIKGFYRASELLCWDMSEAWNISLCFIISLKST